MSGCCWHETCGQRIHREDSYAVRNGPCVPVLNSFLGMLYRSTWLGVMTWCVLVFMLAGSILALLSWGVGCTGDMAASDIIILSIAHIISFGEEGSVHDSQDGRACVMVTSLFSFVALLLQAALFAVTASRFINPHVELCISSRLCVVSREGEDWLTLRVAHPQGFMLSNVEIDCMWLEPHVTSEGEHFYQHHVISFEYLKHMRLPGLAKHRLSAGPLARFGGCIERAEGMISLSVTAIDSGLKTSISNFVCYKPSTDVVHGLWEDVVRLAFYQLLVNHEPSPPPLHHRLWHLLVRKHSSYRGGRPFRGVADLAGFQRVRPAATAQSAARQRTSTCPEEAFDGCSQLPPPKRALAAPVPAAASLGEMTVHENGSAQKQVPQCKVDHDAPMSLRSDVI